MTTALHWAGAATSELALFAAVGFFIIAVDDFIVDLIFFSLRLRNIIWRRPALGEQDHRQTGDTEMAIFVPAWQEADVISNMLKRATSVWGRGQYRIFVGCYPNDPATIAAVSPHTLAQTSGGHVTLVINPKPGPTTKGDCLNQLWRAMCDHEERAGKQFSAIILHDAEDMAHPEELSVYAGALQNCAAVQIPVMPIIDRNNHWISGHYADEFAEAHTRDMAVRQAIGASLPFAGVGCAIRRDAMARFAVARGGLPFDAASLTEDYEMGLRLGDMGLKTAFCRQTELQGRIPVAVHAYFPASFETAIRQKTRWTLGIALLGWQRLGWRGGAAEFWMRCRDRRAIIAALLIVAASLCLISALVISGLAAVLNLPPPSISPLLKTMFLINFAFLIWRAAVRFAVMKYHYSLRQACLSVPRMAVSSFIAVAASFRAVNGYVAYLRGKPLTWDKTEHVFPTLQI